MMRGASGNELVEGKNTIGRKAAVFKKPHKATFNIFLTLPKTALFRFKFGRFFSDQTFYEVYFESDQYFDDGKWRTFGGY